MCGPEQVKDLESMSRCDRPISKSVRNYSRKEITWGRRSRSFRRFIKEAMSFCAAAPASAVLGLQNRILNFMDSEDEDTHTYQPQFSDSRNPHVAALDPEVGAIVVVPRCRNCGARRARPTARHGCLPVHCTQRAYVAPTNCFSRTLCYVDVMCMGCKGFKY